MVIPELSLDGKTAVVTGAGRGIGETIALVLAEAGADVVVSSRTLSEVEETADRIKAMGRQALAIRTDVTSSEEVDAMVAKALETFGKIDIQVNNAGQIIKLPMVPYPDEILKPQQVNRVADTPLTDEEWQRIIDVNLTGVFYCCRAVGPHMLERRYGKLINVSSVYGSVADPLVSAYNASKAGVSMLTRVLALEWAKYGVCVNAIGPGSYRTPMNYSRWDDPEVRKQMESVIPMGRGGNLRDLGILAVYLASSATDYMTGQIVYIDGGRTAN